MQPKEGGPTLMIILVNVAVAYHGYRESGYDVPAPLVPMRGMPAYARATAGLPIDLADRLVFVATDELAEQHGFANDVSLRFPHIPTAVVQVPTTTGSAGAIRAALGHLDETAALVVHPGSQLVRSALAARLGVMSEMMGLAGVIDGDVVGTGAWSADTFVTCDRTGRIDAVATHWSDGAMALTGTLVTDGDSGATRELVRLACEVDPATATADIVTALIRRRLAIGVDRVAASWDLSHAAGLGAYLAHR